MDFARMVFFLASNTHLAVSSLEAASYFISHCKFERIPLNQRSKS